MTYQTCELVVIDGVQVQRTRDMTPAEAAEIDARKAAPPLVPQVLTPRQFRQALNHFGYRTAVETAVSSADQDTKDWYEKASSFERTHPVVLSMAQALGYTATQIDAVWTYGAAR